MKLHLIPRALFLFACLLYFSILTGCNLLQTPALTPTLNVTQAFQTVESKLTQSSSLSPTATNTPLPATAVVSPTATQTELPEPTLSPTATLSATLEPACDKAAPGSPAIDVTIPDDTKMHPGEQFTKIWRLVNTGTCTWTRDYHAVWFFGDKLGDTLSVPIGSRVATGDSVEITVDMRAPDKPGSYQSNWMLSNASSKLFGIGPNGDLPFWVRIVVEKSPASTRLPNATVTPGPTITPTLTATPSLTPTAAPAVLITGTVVLTPTQHLDFDTSLVNPPAGSDMAYQVDATNHHWLVPLGKAVIGVYGNSLPSLHVCQAATMSAAPVAIESISPGTYLCYRTDQKLAGWLRYDKFNSKDGSVLIQYLTWESR
ncbi:MAG: NBR1-Ig-like domain-containing protein [Omnitrophica WOR_2 bacterium]